METVLQAEDARPALSDQGPAAVRIPLRDGRGKIKEYALVDATDLDVLVGYRWYCSNGGYAVRQETVGLKKQRTVLMARTVLGLEFGDGKETDHISRDKLDNRRCNLRIATHAENAQNRRRKRNATVPRGVALRKDRKVRPWAAYGCKDSKQKHLGFYDTVEEAAAAALSWRRENMPFAID